MSELYVYVKRLDIRYRSSIAGRKRPGRATPTPSGQLKLTLGIG